MSEDAKLFCFTVNVYHGEIPGVRLPYHIGGMPDGRTALVAYFGDSDNPAWRVMRLSANGGLAEWTGSYTTFDDALGALGAVDDLSLL